ncbi:hypothetical protein BC835DRAFT_672488 [Cytidiella melzeri]|nr:hypothetical protein BC835DRAFT_672488 [Cytidiella melzeri]
MSFSAFTPRQGTVHLLPEEVLDRIISLAAPRIKDASQVSWTWRSVAVRHMFCTMTVPHRNFAHFLDFISQPQHSYIATHIKELSLQILDGKSLRVRTDANARRTLETLETQLLKSMLERLPRLDHLTVKNLLIYTSPPPTAGQFNLKSLELNLVAPAAAVTDDGIIGMLALFSRIDYLKIFDIQRESAWAKLAARLGATGAVMQGIPGPSVSELEIQLKIGISLFPYLLPLLPGSSTTLRYLALECRTLGDVSGLGYFLSEVGPNITSFYLDLWGLEMVDEDDHDKYIIAAKRSPSSTSWFGVLHQHSLLPSSLRSRLPYGERPAQRRRVRDVR